MVCRFPFATMHEFSDADVEYHGKLLHFGFGRGFIFPGSPGVVRMN